MGRFVEGQDCRQDFLLPASLDDYVSEDNPVRVIAAFIDELDLHALGFAGATPARTCRCDCRACLQQLASESLALIAQQVVSGHDDVVAGSPASCSVDAFSGNASTSLRRSAGKLAPRK